METVRVVTKLGFRITTKVYPKSIPYKTEKSRNPECLLQNGNLKAT